MAGLGSASLGSAARRGRGAASHRGGPVRGSGRQARLGEEVGLQAAGARGLGRGQEAAARAPPSAIFELLLPLPVRANRSSPPRTRPQGGGLQGGGRRGRWPRVLRSHGTPAGGYRELHLRRRGRPPMHLPEAEPTSARPGIQRRARQAPPGPRTAALRPPRAGLWGSLGLGLEEADSQAEDCPTNARAPWRPTVALRWWGIRAAGVPLWGPRLRRWKPPSRPPTSVSSVEPKDELRTRGHHLQTGWRTQT